jgi:two-component system, NtrC family, sensor kinase
MSLHSALLRQLRRCNMSGDPASFDPTQWPELLERIGLAYSQADDERCLQERMLATLSKEMHELNDSLRTSEAKLLEERDMLRAVLVSLGDGVCVLDARGVVRFVNPEGLRLFAAAEAELVGRPALEICPALSSEAITTGLCVRVDDVFFKRPCGTTFPASFVMTSIKRDDTVHGAVLVFRDISDKLQAESELRQAQKLESVGRLAAGVAHEINTPIQFVSDSVRFVSEAATDLFTLVEKLIVVQRSVQAGRPSDEAAQQAAQAEANADLAYLVDNVPKALDRSLDGLNRVATIVRSMKEFAHPDQKRMAAVDLNRAIDSTLTIARNEYKYVADVVTDFGPLPLVMCHGGDVNQVVLNIVINAAHAIGDIVGDSGVKGRITVRTRREGEQVLITIEDTGGGIPLDVQSKIFDPFFTTKEVGKGTGQGLAIARSVIVDKHQGELSFDSQVGHGTTFSIRLPIRGHAPE